MSMEMNKAPVEQAVGDERAAFEQWLEQHMSHHFSPELDLAKYEDSGEYRYNPAADYWKAWQARAALAKPSPAQAEQHWPKLEKPAQVGAIRFRAGLSSRLVVEAAQRLYEFESTPEKEAERIERLQAFREQCFEPLGAEFSKVLSENLVELSSEAKPEQEEAERPEVVASVVHSNPVVLGQCGPLNANDELMTVAQHAASVARWAEMFNRVEQERDAALARVAELEKQEPVATVAKVPGEDWNSLDFHRDLQHMQPGTKLYAAPVARAQHSVPDGWKLVPSKPTIEMVEAGYEESLGMPDRSGHTRVMEQYEAMLAAAPGKEGV
ncbi:TPA: hypothetical protein ACKP9G_003693 [Pseudomonas aeruginosa]